MTNAIATEMASESTKAESRVGHQPGIRIENVVKHRS